MEGEQTFDNSFTIWYHVVAMKMHSSRNSVYLLNYHIVCIPKYRRSILQGEIRESLFTILGRIVKERYWETLALEVMPDHAYISLLL
jgi:putative transposase